MVGADRVELTPDDVDLSQETKEGWGVAAGGGLTVALDLGVTRELRLEGLAREMVRLVQDVRKSAGLNVSDRIDLGIETSGDLAEALSAHREYVAGETLAVSVTEGPVPDAVYREDAAIEGMAFTVSLRTS